MLVLAGSPTEARRMLERARGVAEKLEDGEGLARVEAALLALDAGPTLHTDS